MFCSETLSLDIHVDINLTHANIQNIVANQVQSFMPSSLFLVEVASFSRILHIAQTDQE